MDRVKFWCHIATNTRRRGRSRHLPVGGLVDRLVGGLVGALFLVLAVNASATTPLEDLQKRLQALDGLRGEFTQNLINAYGRVVEASTGEILLSKPHLRWETLTPFPQVITVDDEWVKIYDPDLEQVTQRPVAQDAAQVPLALLTRTELSLADTFTVSVIPNNTGDSETLSNAEDTPTEVSQFEIRPISDEALFQHIELKFSDNVLHSMTIYDHVGQQTVIVFTALLVNQTIASEALELQLPPDTDIVQG